MKQQTLFNYVELKDNFYFYNDTWSFKSKKYIRYTYKNGKGFFRPFHLGKSYLENTKRQT